MPRTLISASAMFLSVWVSVMIESSKLTDSSAMGSTLVPQRWRHTPATRRTSSAMERAARSGAS